VRSSSRTICGLAAMPPLASALCGLVTSLVRATGVSFDGVAARLLAIT
jgi:hypothetical protein